MISKAFFCKNILQFYYFKLFIMSSKKNYLYPKRDQSWVFIGRPNAEAETLILWPPHAKS